MVAVQQIAEYLAERLASAGIEVERLILFGSRSQGKDDSDSDIDLAVISPSFEDKDIYERGSMTAMPVAETIWHFGIPIDLIELTPTDMLERKRLVCSYVTRGIVIPVRVSFTAS